MRQRGRSIDARRLVVHLWAATVIGRDDVLLEILSVVAGEPDLTRLLATTMDHLRRHVACTGGSIATVERDELVVRAAIGPLADQALTQRLPRGRGRSWQVVETGETFLSADLVADGFQAPHRPGGPALRSYLAVPLRWREAVFGIIEIDSIEPRAFHEADRQLLERVAALLGGPIELASRYAAEVRLADELASAKAQLEVALGRAEHALQAREQFLGIASHELKTPLTPIKAAAQLLRRLMQRVPPDLERVARQLTIIDLQVERMRVLIDDLLDLTRVQGGRLVLRRRRVDLADLAGRVIRAVDAPRRSRLRLVAERDLVGHWDAARLKQVLVNLIENALKYSPADADVEVRLVRHGAQVILRVIDHGIGVPAAAQATLFEPFARGENVSARNYGGLGLGLFVANQIVQGHGGTIEVESTEGQGATFTVRLPLDGGRTTRA